MPKKTPLVAVIMTNWNGLQDTETCLESFRSVTYRNFLLIIVDNGSKKNEAKILIQKYGKIFGNRLHCIRLEKNYGYIGGLNVGLKFAREKFKPDYFLLMNNDVIVDPNFLSKLIQEMEHDPCAGLASPKIFSYPEGNVQFDGVYQIKIGFTFRYAWKPATVTAETDFATACCLLVKSKVIDKIGFPDARFFLTAFDTVEYCHRAQQRGFKILFVPESKIWHKLSRAAISWSFVSRYKFELKDSYCVVAYAQKPINFHH
jgi:GT2 family glycosyltransferase